MKKIILLVLILVSILFISMPVSAEADFVVIEGEAPVEVIEQLPNIPLNDSESPIVHNDDMSIDTGETVELEITEEPLDLTEELLEEEKKDIPLEIVELEEEEISEETSEEPIDEVDLVEQDLPVEEEVIVDSEALETENPHVFLEDGIGSEATEPTCNFTC